MYHSPPSPEVYLFWSDSVSCQYSIYIFWNVQCKPRWGIIEEVVIRGHWSWNKSSRSSWEVQYIRGTLLQMYHSSSLLLKNHPSVALGYTQKAFSDGTGTLKGSSFANFQPSSRQTSQKFRPWEPSCHVRKPENCSIFTKRQQIEIAISY